MAFSKCSDICTLQVCKLCSNSADEFQFQAFPHFLPGLHTGNHSAV